MFKRSKFGSAEHERLDAPLDSKDQEFDVRLSPCILTEC